MIVTQQMAQNAARELNLPCGGEGFEKITTDDVTSAFRILAKHCHPDKGGTTEAFVALDRAKCILEYWLARPRVQLDAAISSETCIMCNGSGRRTLRRGFRTMTMVCGSCRGLGERVPPDKVEE